MATRATRRQSAAKRADLGAERGRVMGRPLQTRSQRRVTFDELRSRHNKDSYLRRKAGEDEILAYAIRSLVFRAKLHLDTAYRPRIFEHGKE